MGTWQLLIQLSTSPKLFYRCFLANLWMQPDCLTFTSDVHLFVHLSQLIVPPKFNMIKRPNVLSYSINNILLLLQYSLLSLKEMCAVF